MSSKTNTTATKEEATPALVPKLRFPEFRGKNGWENKLVGPYLEDCSGRVPPDTELPVYSSTREGLKRQDAYFDGRVLQNKNEYGVVPPGCLVYRHMSDDGLFKFNINETGGDIAVSKEYPVFSTKGLNPIFLLAKLNDGLDFKQFALSQKAGGTRTRLYFSRLCEWRTLLPSLSEQQKIAECLSSVDEVIAAQARKVDALKSHKKALMQQLFPREGETTPNARFCGFSEPWKGKVLGDLSTTTIGEFVIKTKQHPDAPYPVFNGGRSHTGFYDQYNNEGDKIVISARGANAGYVNIVKRRYWAGNSCYSVSLNDRNDSLDFVYWFMKQNERTFIENQHAANIPAVSKSHVERFKIMLPSPKEQKRIADCLNSLDALITAETQKLEALKLHKKGLMQQLFPSQGEGEG